MIRGLGIAVAVCLGVVVLAGCDGVTEPPVVEVAAPEVEAPSVSEPSEARREMLFADDNVRLIDLLADENRAYREWRDERVSDRNWDNREAKHYLTESIYILEEERSLFVVNEQTGEKRLAVEGGIYHEDPSGWNDEEDNYENVWFDEKIDENRFVYKRSMGQWRLGDGVFDISDFSSHSFSVDGETWLSRGVFWEYIYGVGKLDKNADHADYLRTSINTYETDVILPDLPKEYRHFYNSGFSTDGAIFAVVDSTRGLHYDSELDLSVRSQDVSIYSVESQELLVTYTIKTRNIPPELSYINFIDDHTFYMVEGNFHNSRYLIEVDISGLVWE